MKPETLEEIKAESERLYPVIQNLNTFSPSFDFDLESDVIANCKRIGFETGAIKYAELLESEREKSEKLADALKSLLLICGHPTSEIYEDAKKVFDEYKTTSK